MTTPRFIAYQLPPMDAQAGRAAGDAFYRQMSQRRSVRSFDPRPVPREMIEVAIRAAGTAPSGANLQPWHFVAISDPGIKARIREGAEAEERENYGGRMSEDWLEDLAHLGTDENKPMLEDAPWLIAVFREASRPDGRKTYYSQESVGIAVGMLLAALHLQGLATLTHTPSPMRFLSEILRRPANERPFLLIPVGYPAPDCQVPDIARKPLDAILTVMGPETE